MWLIRVALNRGPPRFEGERRFGGDRDGYRGGPRGAGGDFGGDKGGAPADYRPSFGVILLPMQFCFCLSMCICIMVVIFWPTSHHHDCCMLFSFKLNSSFNFDKYLFSSS